MERSGITMYRDFITMIWKLLFNVGCLIFAVVVSLHTCFVDSEIHYVVSKKTNLLIMKCRFISIS